MTVERLYTLDEGFEILSKKIGCSMEQFVLALLQCDPDFAKQSPHRISQDVLNCIQKKLQS